MARDFSKELQNLRSGVSESVFLTRLAKADSELIAFYNNNPTTTHNAQNNAQQTTNTHQPHQQTHQHTDEFEGSETAVLQRLLDTAIEDGNVQAAKSFLDALEKRRERDVRTPYTIFHYIDGVIENE